MNLLKTSITGGLSLASFHVIWILLVAVGWAQALMDFIFKLHMLNSPFQVQPFELSLAIGLIAMTFTIGFICGVIFYFIKNSLSGNYSSLP